jgi:hypothetical protein
MISKTTNHDGSGEFFLCCFFGVLNSAKDLTPYLYPELKLFAVKDILTNTKQNGSGEFNYPFHIANLHLKI